MHKYIIPKKTITYRPFKSFIRDSKTRAKIEAKASKALNEITCFASLLTFITEPPSWVLYLLLKSNPQQ